MTKPVFAVRTNNLISGLPLCSQSSRGKRLPARWGYCVVAAPRPDGVPRHGRRLRILALRSREPDGYMGFVNFHSPGGQ